MVQVRTTVQNQTLAPLLPRHSGDGGGYMVGGSGGSQLKMVETLKTSITAGFRVLQK